MWMPKERIQEIRGTNKLLEREYTNCGGFALGTGGWYSPGNNERWFCDNAWECRNNEQWRRFEKRCVRFLVEEFPDLKPVKRDEIYNVSIDIEKYEIIGFRIRRDRLFSDFHFIKCDENGNWKTKHGYLAESTSRYECLDEVWDTYDGKEFYFVRRRDGKQDEPKKRAGMTMHCTNTKIGGEKKWQRVK